MYRREAGTSKPGSQGHPSRGGTTVGGGTKSKPRVYHSPTPSPQRTPRSAPGRAVQPYSRSEKKVVKKVHKGRRRFAKDLFLSDLKRGKSFAKFAREHFWTEPSKLARGNFKSVTDEMWKELGLQGKKPKVTFNDVPKEKGRAVAYAWKGLNNVFIEPGLAERAQYDKSAYNVFAHEAAHTRQSPKNKRDEGSAEAFADTKGLEALRKSGVKTHPWRSTKGYERSAKKVRRGRGKRYVTKGQFER